MFRPFFPVCHLGDLSSVFILTRSLHPCLILNHPSAISQSHKKDINYLFTVHVRPITEKTPSNRTCHFCRMPFCNVPCSIMSAHVSFYPSRPSSSVHVAPLTQQELLSSSRTRTPDWPWHCQEMFYQSSCTRRSCFSLCWTDRLGRSGEEVHHWPVSGRLKALGLIHEISVCAQPLNH